ncbi:MAG: NAD-dependent deacylase [bacterium]
MKERIKQAAEWMMSARKTIAFTGAGVSTESGIPDFRSASGLWSRYDPAEYATLGAFQANPEKVWRMLAEMEHVMDVQPNAGHEALARLERNGALSGIVTQNIDGLHQAAGSATVVEFHGSSRTFTCLPCGRSFPREAVRGMPKKGDSQMPMPGDCGRRPPDGGGNPCVLKPDVVFFDEAIPPEALAGAANLVQGADLVLVAGTSCEVFPAAEIPWQVRRQGGRVIEINLEPAASLKAELVLQGPFTEMALGLHQAWEVLKS